MALSSKARRRWSLLLLLIGLPIYIMVAVTIINMIGRAPILIELLIYMVLGVIWVLPFKAVFTGIGQPDPDASGEDE